MAEENRRGYHHTASQGHDHNTGAQGRMAPAGKPHKHMAEPTNHGGHTYSGEMQREHDRRTEATRMAHGQRGHAAGLSKYGAEHHIRGEESPAHERTESAAERKAEGE